VNLSGRNGSEIINSPTPEEIAAACRQIREEWTEEEFYLRAGVRRGGWLPPGCLTGAGINDPHGDLADGK
jgi:hypothetical protein